MDFWPIQNMSNLVTYHVIEHVMGLVTCYWFDHVRPGHLIVEHVPLVSQDHVLVLSQGLLVGLST